MTTVRVIQNKNYRKIVTLCLLFITIGIKGQDYFTGITVDAITNEPLPYVNIGILNKGIGTVSNDDGKFILKISKEEYWAEKLQFSSIGYETVSILVRDLVFNATDFPKVEMKTKIERLDGVILSNKGELKVFPEIVGYETINRLKFGYWNENIALGGELATRIPVRKGPRKLRRLSFDVVEKAADSVLVRVNIYNDGGNLPQENLAKENILVTLNTAGVTNVDLTSYDLEVTNDFIVSLELVQVYGDKINLVLLASNRNGDSFRRYASMDKWEKIEGAAMAYVLDTDYYTLAKGRYKKKKARSKRAVSGYVFKRGVGVSNISVLNETTKEKVVTDAKGRYSIDAETNDILSFIVSETIRPRRRLGDEQTINISL